MSINFLAVFVVSVAAFALSTGYYMYFGKARNELLGFKEQADFRPAPGKILTELVRTMLLAAIFAIILNWTNHATLGGGVKLAALLWVAFPGILLMGSVMWDKVPSKLAAIHAGDWALKLLLMGVVLGVWR